MKKGFPKREEQNRKDQEQRHYLDNIDLVNLRLDIPSNRTTPRSRPLEKGSGDTYNSSTRRRHSLERTEARFLIPNVNKQPHGYGSRVARANAEQSENLILLYAKDKDNADFKPEPISKLDFLYPSKKRGHKQVIDVISEERMLNSRCKVDNVDSGNFPFKITPSGNLKVDSTQVVFSSNKLSVLVADPKNTKVNIHSDHMAHDHLGHDISKPSAMETIMSQAGFSSIGSILGNTPVRNGSKEASEYESKRTSEILDPELNLGRLGYTGADAIDWERIKLPEKQNLYLELYHRITNNTNADCKIYIDNEEFSCHLIVLQCYSELFDAYVAVKKVELPSDKCSAASFSFIYDWMITGEPSYIALNRENVLDIFNSAKYLKIKDLVEQCWAFIDNVEVFNEDTAFLLYMDAKKKDLPEVRELMLPRIQQFFLMLVSSQDWLELDVDDIKNLLKSNYVGVNCEMEVFMSAVRWLKHDWENRDKFKYEILECVRFGNLAPWQLVDIKRNPENPDFMELARDARVCKMIDDGLAFVIIRYWYGHDQADFLHWNTVLGLRDPGSRNWNGSEKTYFTYREFLIFLDQYRRSQLIEKNKPKIINDGEKRVKEHRDGGGNAEKNTPRVPTMEEFLSKKKKHSGNAPCRHHHNYARKLRRKPMEASTEIEAATTIQKAFRKYLKLKSINNNKKVWLPPRNTGRNLHNKSSEILQKLGNQITNKYLLSENSLFDKNFDTVLIFGGTDPFRAYGIGRNTGKDIFKYVVPQNVWEFVLELPEPRCHHRVELLKGNIFVVGGVDPREEHFETSNVAKTVWSLDPATRIWYHHRNMLTPRKHFGLVSANRCLYAIGGQTTNSSVLKSMERFDPLDGCWESQTPMPFKIMKMGCAKYKNQIWIAGGVDDKNNVLNGVMYFEVKAKQWTKVADLRSPRHSCRLLATPTSLFLVGGAAGVTPSGGVVDIDQWEESAGGWRPASALSVARHGHVATPLGTQVLIVGGVEPVYGKALSGVECYCLMRRTRVRGVGCLPMPLVGHDGVTLPPANFM